MRNRPAAMATPQTNGSHAGHDQSSETSPRAPRAASPRNAATDGRAVAWSMSLRRRAPAPSWTVIEKGTPDLERTAARRTDCRRHRAGRRFPEARPAGCRRRTPRRASSDRASRQDHRLGSYVWPLPSEQQGRRTGRRAELQPSDRDRGVNRFPLRDTGSRPVEERATTEYRYHHDHAPGTVGLDLDTLCRHGGFASLGVTMETVDGRGAAMLDPVHLRERHPRLTQRASRGGGGRCCLDGGLDRKSSRRWNAARLVFTIEDAARIPGTRSRRSRRDLRDRATSPRASDRAIFLRRLRCASDIRLADITMSLMTNGWPATGRRTTI